MGYEAVFGGLSIGKCELGPASPWDDLFHVLPSQRSRSRDRPTEALAYNPARFLWGGSKWPRTPGAIPEGEPTPTVVLNLQPGELVRVKSHEKILQTITTANFNRGMRWDAELVPYCGGTYRVLKRVNQIIHEQTGKMQKMKTPCIILEDVTCQALYSACRMNCPKAMYPYWREIWLERVSAAAAESEWSERETKYS